MEHQKKSRYYETPEFERLNQEWQAILKETGFVDIEASTLEYAQINGIGFTTRSNRFQTREATDEYYRCIDNFLNGGTFKSETQRTILEMHAQGLTGIEIAKALGKSKQTVYYYINGVKKQIGLKLGKR